VSRQADKGKEDLHRPTGFDAEWLGDGPGPGWRGHILIGALFVVPILIYVFQQAA
jgi:hypothetical protein